MQQLVELLKQVFDVDDIPVSEQGVISMTVDNQYKLCFEYHETGHFYVLYHGFGYHDLPAVLCRELLCANMMGTDTFASHFSIDARSGELFFERHLLVEQLDVKLLKLVVMLFLESVKTWHTKLPNMLKDIELEEKKPTQTSFRLNELK